jgi:hypothetical protein
MILATALCLALAGTASCSGIGEADSFSLVGVNSIQVRAGSLDIEVHATDVFGVSVNANLPQQSLFDSRSYRLMHRQSGSSLEVWVESDNFFGITRSGRIRLEVPRDANLRLETSSGSIAVDGIEGAGCIARSVSGSVTVRDVQGNLDLNSVSGTIAIDSVEGRVQAQTISGGIRGSGVLPTESSNFTSVSGSINVKLDAALDDLRFDLSTVSGAIVIGKILAERGLKMGFGGVTIKAHSVSGSLNFQ